VQSTLSTATDVAERGARGRKLKAVLAGGIVLGLGAAVTLAVWTDDEFVNGTFTVGTFVFDGSTDGVTFAEHPTAPGAALAFELSATAANMSPGDVVEAPFAIRLQSTDTAEVTLDNVTAAGGLGFTYAVEETDVFGCDTAGEVVIPSTALAAGAGAADLDTMVDDQVRYFCFTVTAGSTIVQGSTTTAVWQFTATSVE
jgi:predicted ribosomally synthesized peptide with SipW-like signal peptide